VNQLHVEVKSDTVGLRGILDEELEKHFPASN